MGNNYFRFKQFTILQDQCAMKVCTDACIFGAYMAATICNSRKPMGNMLDIGTGTGLLSLMVAQKNVYNIEAVEIDADAFNQAAGNFQRSPWGKRLTIFHTDVLKFYPRKQYDCIVCNPPFFENDLKSGDVKKDTARHDTSFTIDQLLSLAGSLLTPDGFLSVLLPASRVLYFIEIARMAGFFVNEQLMIRHNNAQPFSRAVLVLSRQQATAIYDELHIKDPGGNHSGAFIDLLKDYYLYL